MILIIDRLFRKHINRIVLTRHDCAFTDIDTGIQGQSMLVSFNPLCSGRNISVKRRNSHNTSAFVFLAVTITYLTWMGRIDGPFACECYASSAHNLFPIINHPSSDLQKPELPCKHLKLIIHSSICSSNGTIKKFWHDFGSLDDDEVEKCK